MRLLPNSNGKRKVSINYSEVYMQEKRKSERQQVNIRLEISSLFKQDNVIVDHIDTPIVVDNISKLGIGFRSKSKLPLDFYFNAKIELGGEDSTLFTVVKIIRIEEKEKEYIYGAQFIGLSSVFDYIFDEYQIN